MPSIRPDRIVRIWRWVNPLPRCAGLRGSAGGRDAAGAAGAAVGLVIVLLGRAGGVAPAGEPAFEIGGEAAPAARPGGRDRPRPSGRSAHEVRCCAGRGWLLEDPQALVVAASRQARPSSGSGRRSTSPTRSSARDLAAHRGRIGVDRLGERVGPAGPVQHEAREQHLGRALHPVRYRVLPALPALDHADRARMSWWARRSEVAQRSSTPAGIGSCGRHHRRSLRAPYNRLLRTTMRLAPPLATRGHRREPDRGCPRERSRMPARTEPNARTLAARRRRRVGPVRSTACATSSTGHVATITYDRPDKLNAIDGAMRDGLNAAFDRFRDDDEAWVGIVTGAGRAFCVGADLRDGERQPGGRVRRHVLGEARRSTPSRAAGRSSSRSSPRSTGSASATG